MAFLNQFATYFDSQERQTELYALWSAIGVNMEKAILEEQNKINAEYADINNFSEDTMRSWLAFFLKKIPYRTTATSQVTVSLITENAKKTQIPKYSQLSTDTGVIYTLYEDVFLVPGDKRTVTAVQGKRIIETGTYNSLIKVQATNPDLNYLEVKINGVEIPEVSYETSYDQLSFRGNWKPQNDGEHPWGGTPYLQNKFGTKGAFYSVIADGTTRFEDEAIPIEFREGDIVVYDGKSWQRSAYTNNLQPIQFTNTYAVPRNGYFAYYYNDYLYIKIFAGSDVEDPNGDSYEVAYINSDGIQGQVDENTLTFISSFEDADENPVELNVLNTASTSAANEPSVGKLGLYLKERLYSTINVSSVPEYTNWFNAQPEVGDCLVLSDYEKWIRSGKDVLNPTGIVSVYLVGVDGKPLNPETQVELLERIEPYKDIAVLHIEEFTNVKQHLAFEYTTSTNESAFEQFVQSIAMQYYNLSYLQSKNASVFEDLDLSAIVQDILENSPYESTGLILKGYHYRRYPYDEDTYITMGERKFTLESYTNELPGTGWYILECYDDNGNLANTWRFEEIEEFQENAESSVKSCMIFGPKNTSRPIGSHVDKIVTFDIEEYDFTTAVLKCYWGMANEGILSIGAQDGLRELESITITRAK